MIKEGIMENTVKISYSAVSHIGAGRTVNEDRIYTNGKFMSANEADYTQISLEGSDSQYIFAVSDGMDTDGYNAGSAISVMEDLKKFHLKTKNSVKDIQVKLDEMLECIEQSNNLFYSVSLGDNDNKSRNAAFAGLIIDSGSIAAVNLGSSRIYKYDGSNLKLIVNDYKRTERLLKMGIIIDEQAEILSGQNKNIAREGKSPAKKSDIYPLKEGAVYLICSNGLTDAVSEDAIFDILDANDETDVAANLLVKEAINNDGEDNITAVVIRVDSVGDVDDTEETPVRSIPGRRNTARISRFTRDTKKRKLDVAKLVSSLILVAVIAAVVFLAFETWFYLRNPNSKDTSASTTSETTTVDETLPPEDVVVESTQETIAEDAVAEETDVAENTAGTTYTIKKGDNLFQISKKFYGNANKYKLIMEANNITDENKIIAGQVLKIPAVE
jgi:PPM family protein phosphatase